MDGTQVARRERRRFFNQVMRGTLDDDLDFLQATILVRKQAIARAAQAEADPNQQQFDIHDGV